PAPNVAAVLKALDILETEPQHVEQLWDNAEYMRQNLNAPGYDTGVSNTPIIPVKVGDEYRTVLTWMALVDEGVYTNPVLPPAVPHNGSLLRTSYTATHRREHLDRALNAFKIVGERL